MEKRIVRSSCVIAMGVLLLGCSTVQERGSFEYKEITHLGRNGPPEPVLNELASQGWRVIGFSRESAATDTFLLERKK